MKRLLLTFGLVIAFFVFPVRATIFDVASYQLPRIETTLFFNCGVNDVVMPLEMVEACYQAYLDLSLERIGAGTGDCHLRSDPAEKISHVMFCDMEWPLSDGKTGRTTYTYTGAWQYRHESEVRHCPPESFPNYTYEHDYSGDGKPDRCYNPIELANASRCQNQVGSMLPGLTNSATTVCKTDSGTGARCGYSRKAGDNAFLLDLEVSCFGDDDLPEYQDEPIPEPDTCAKMNDQLMVCKSNPDEKCDFYGRCEKDCGYVNGQFYCFESCSGAQCDEEIPPEVDCVNNPSDPSCPTVEPEVPENCTKSGAGLLCKENPEDKCDADGVCQKGCGEVNGVFVCYQSPSEGSDLLDIDLQPVVDELKALNKKLDFETVKNRFSLDDLGSFGTIFGESDIEKVNSQISDKQSEIDNYIKTLKSEYSSMFELKGSGGAYEPITLDLSMGTFNVGFWDFIHNNSGVIASVIMFLAYLMAARVVLE